MNDVEAHNELKKRLEGTNVSSKSFLATDFLNLYNEVFMLLEMVPDMPDMLEELEDWQPKSYVDHFKESTIADKDIAIEAYEHCPLQYRLPFDQLSDRLNQIILDTLTEAQKLYQANEMDSLNNLINQGLIPMKKIWEALNAIIHSDDTTANQTAVDDLLDEPFNLSISA